jgi:hypothetical protein
MMKTTLKNALGWGSVFALVAGFSSTAMAGPGPQYWQQMEKIRAENTAKAHAATPAATPAAKPACVSCKTDAIREFRPSALSGKIPDRYVTIGSKHECAACGGAITTVRGKTTDDMKSNCPICAKANASKTSCCTTSS